VLRESVAATGYYRRHIPRKEDAAPFMTSSQLSILAPSVWGQQLIEALTDPDSSVAGGSIEHAPTDTVRSWAAFLCEYSACLSPLPGGAVTSLPGSGAGDVLSKVQ